MRLIDADAMKATGVKLTYMETEWTPATAWVVPIVDAEPVVRCKDCKYYLNSNEKCGLIDTRLHFYETDKTWTEDCFCSWAERKADETG